MGSAYTKLEPVQTISLRPSRSGSMPSKTSVSTNINDMQEGMQEGNRNSMLISYHDGDRDWLGVSCAIRRLVCSKYNGAQVEIVNQNGGNPTFCKWNAERADVFVMLVFEEYERDPLCLSLAQQVVELGKPIIAIIRGTFYEPKGDIETLTKSHATCIYWERDQEQAKERFVSALAEKTNW